MMDSEPTRLASLAALNRRSRERGYELEDIDWSQPIARDSLWAPEHTGTLYYLPIYEELTVAEKLRYNQLTGLGICEQFIYLEENAIIRPMARMLQRAELPLSLRESLCHFIREEEKHTAMFWRLLKLCEPGWYTRSRYRLCRVSPFQQLALGQTARYPDIFLVWLWAALFVEERSLWVSREYLRARKDCAGVDEMITRVHEYHLKDEVRHCQLDHHLIRQFYDHRPRWKKLLCAFSLRQLLRGYISTKRTTERILQVLSDEFPRLRSRIGPEAKRQLATVGGNLRFQKAMYGERVVPRMLRLLAERSEYDGIWDLLPAVERRGG